ncbi:MAG: hypothetical protein KDA33_11845, partial [Phycisphaerales bacterium]|nr:hypothetical protein [Phycisphaerales bacterium]
RRAAEELYLSRNGVPASACLGIQHTQCIDGRYDSRVAPGMYALRVDIVFPNTAADRAGIRPGDLIIGLNGDIAASEAECNSFTPWIATQMPGAQCEFTVLRDVVGRTYRPSRERGIDSRGFRDLSTRIVRGADDARLPYDAVALEVTSVRDADPRLDLAVGDLIVALNGKRLPAQDPKGALEAWANTRRETEPDAGDSRVPNLPPGFLPRNARRSLRESIQILRGGQRIALEATLGRWPLYISATRDVRRGVRRERLLKLSVEFNQWWREPASSDGLMQNPVSPDPAMFWQMEQ